MYQETKTMKTTLKRLIIGSVLVVGSLSAGMASAETVFGKITFLGTMSEEFGVGTHARFRMRVDRSTCGGDNTPKTRWIHVRSGRMDSQFAHNSANLRNAYSTLLVAFMTATTVQIDGVSSCAEVLTIDLPSSAIGIF
jgi:hypothetical protein